MAYIIISMKDVTKIFHNEWWMKAKQHAIARLS